MVDHLLTEKQAAELTGLSVFWFQRKRWEGGGPPFIKFDRAVRYRSEDLVVWLDQRAGFQSTSEYGSRRPAETKR